MSIRTSLQDRLELWRQAQNPVPDIAWENRQFQTPDVTVSYLRAYLMPAIRAGHSLCSIEERGIFQVSIYRPRDEGPTASEKLAESLITQFKPGLYPGFRIELPPYYSQGMNTEDGRWMLPVSIPYRAAT